MLVYRLLNEGSGMSIQARLGRGLRAHVDAPELIEVSGDTVRDALDDLIDSHPQLARFVLDDARRLRRHVNVFVNDQQLADRIDLSDPIRDGDRLHILPAVSGGDR